MSKSLTKKGCFVDDFGRKYQFHLFDKTVDTKDRQMQELASFPNTEDSKNAIKIGELEYFFQNIYIKVDSTDNSDVLGSGTSFLPSYTYVPFTFNVKAVKEDLYTNLIGVTGGSAWFKVERVKRKSQNRLNKSEHYTKDYDNQLSYSLPTPESGSSEVSFFGGSLKAICTHVLEPNLIKSKKGYAKSIVLLNFTT